MCAVQYMWLRLYEARVCLWVWLDCLDGSFCYRFHNMHLCVPRLYKLHTQHTRAHTHNIYVWNTLRKSKIKWMRWWFKWYSPPSLCCAMCTALRCANVPITMHSHTLHSIFGFILFLLFFYGMQKCSRLAHKIQSIFIYSWCKFPKRWSEMKW